VFFVTEWNLTWEYGGEEADGSNGAGACECNGGANCDGIQTSFGCESQFAADEGGSERSHERPWYVDNISHILYISGIQVKYVE